MATPLEWAELDERGMRSDLFTLRDVAKRMVERDDPWAGMRRHVRSLARAMRRLDIPGS
ncbi:hypothetical protein [[Mycobacterium] nativiensis]|uniref:Uncharacterized protein n=1 Tax=[Mycobacterium] nativiensis TaxID=2855503 RepID=A0ABU5XYW0_9MYCO|nr:hypothetical protein [Mycolicibacter sp. MYC340]MEB3033184.1 hypothetical protein [Mycolicibacter sp. MYC340]